MNKRILYALVFTSIFILSTVSLVAQPAAGAHWKLGIPEQAKGMTIESEVKIYDEDTWEEHLGYCADVQVDEKFGGDADNVGAKSKSKIIDWEGKDIKFLTDVVLEQDIPLNCDGTQMELMDTKLTTFWSAIELIDEILEEIAYENTTGLKDDPPFLEVDTSLVINASIGAAISCGPISQLAVLTNLLLDADNPFLPGYQPYLNMSTDEQNAHHDSPRSIAYWANYTRWITEVGTLSRGEVEEKWGQKTYKGTEINRDIWDFAKGGNFESSPDEKKQKDPILHDPHDYFDSYNNLVGFISAQGKKIDHIIRMIDSLRVRFNNCLYRSMEDEYGVTAGNQQWVCWYAANMSVGMALNEMYNLSLEENEYYRDLYVQARTINGGDLVATYLDALVNETGENPLQKYTGYPAGLKYIMPEVYDAVPMQKKEYLAMLFGAGIYAMQPVDKFLEKIINDFDIDGDRVWGDDFTMYNDTTRKDNLHIGGISIEGRVVTIEYEWAEPIYDDPNDLEKERKDYKIIYTYGETGGQISIEYVGSEPFFKIEGIAPLIPGYEITILLASAAISAIALIYVVMKKKRM
ncbi:MAG: hypothetical protein ACFE96_16365 [Candidatus Hermodarchaeota archaeon]